MRPNYPQKIAAVAGFIFTAISLQAQIYMMKNANTDGTGVYDYNKYVGTLEGGIPIVTGIGGGIEDYDSQLCWAASASNVLQWWQTNAANGAFNGIPAGIVADSGAPNFPAFFSNTPAEPLYTNSVMSSFAKNWKDDPNSASRAFNWWVNGSATTLSPTISAGYYDGLMRYNYGSNAYKEWDYKTESDVFKYVAQASRTGTGLSFRIGKNDGGHIMTIWGAEHVNGEYFLYITDSDDGASELRRLKLYSEPGAMYLRLEEYDGWSVTGATPFKPNLAVTSSYARNSEIGGTLGSGDSLIGGAYYFGRESGKYDADIATRVLLAKNLYVEANTEVWVDVDFLNVNDYIECDLGFYKDTLTWTDSSKVYFDFSDLSGDADLLEIMRGETLTLALFNSTDFDLSDFALTEGSLLEGFSGSFSWDNSENPTALYFSIIPEPPLACCAFALAALLAALRRGKGRR